MIELKKKGTGNIIGTLSDEQLKFLIDELEEEHDQDQDYWLNQAQIELFREKGADPELLGMLENALGDEDDLEVEWERK